MFIYTFYLSEKRLKQFFVFKKSFFTFYYFTMKTLTPAARARMRETPRYKRTARLVLAALCDYHNLYNKPVSIRSLVKYITREYHLHEMEFRDLVPHCIANGVAFGAIRKTKGMFTLGSALHSHSLHNLPVVRQALLLRGNIGAKERTRPGPRPRVSPIKKTRKRPAKRRFKQNQILIKEEKIIPHLEPKMEPASSEKSTTDDEGMWKVEPQRENCP